MHSLNLLCHSKTDARFLQDIPKAVWSIPYVSVALLSSLKQNFIAYRSSKVSDCIFEIQQLWQSGFSNCYRSCSFESEIIKIGQSSHKMYSNTIVSFQESMTILNASTKKSRNLLKGRPIYKLVTLVEGKPKNHFSLATTSRCETGSYSFPWIAPLYP